uniref:Uncharacterized protein n=1 Tax=Peronospora matthiolae TaxID=2874970 RepID=A0AAV1UUK1_9STRA
MTQTSLDPGFEEAPGFCFYSNPWVDPNKVPVTTLDYRFHTRR